jgi:hypothetical protein
MPVGPQPALAALASSSRLKVAARGTVGKLDEHPVDGPAMHGRPLNQLKIFGRHGCCWFL